MHCVKGKPLSYFYDSIHNYFLYEVDLAQEVSIPLLLRKSGEDNLPAQMPIEGKGIAQIKWTKARDRLKLPSVSEAFRHK